MPTAEVEIGKLLTAAPHMLARVGWHAQPQPVERRIERLQRDHRIVAVARNRRFEQPRRSRRLGKTRDISRNLDMPQCDPLDHLLRHIEMAEFRMNMRHTASDEETGRAFAVRQDRLPAEAERKAGIERIERHGGDPFTKTHSYVPPCGEAMGTSRHRPSVSAPRCHLPIAARQGGTTIRNSSAPSPRNSARHRAA